MSLDVPIIIVIVGGFKFLWLLSFMYGLNEKKCSNEILFMDPYLDDSNDIVPARFRTPLYGTELDNTLR